MTNLDSDLLRTFVAVAETGSFTRGAIRVHRSQSATSLQINRLEKIVGQPLFLRHGRGVRTTGAGDLLLPVARQVIRSLDETLDALREKRLGGRLRIGIPDDQHRDSIGEIIAAFASRYREVDLEVQSVLGSRYEADLASGDLDLAVFEVPEARKGDDVLRRDRLIWLVHRDSDAGVKYPLPVALFDRECWWRNVALADLDAAGRPYRIAFTSESSMGVRSAVATGIAAGLLSERNAGRELVPVDGLDSRHPTVLVMRNGKGASGNTLEAMRMAIRVAFGEAR